jgi:hypothetical protein
MPRKPAKKITAKKPADPVVVLERWYPRGLSAHRLVYDVEMDLLAVEFRLMSYWVDCTSPTHLPVFVP